MITKTDLKSLVLEAVKANGGEASIVDVARHIWKEHEKALRESGDIFFTWQYDMRWAAQDLRGEGGLTFSGRKWALK